MSHTSHMYPVYPGDLITQEKTPELLEAAERSMERRTLHAAEQGAGPEHGESASWPGFTIPWSAAGC